jgi:hypothetical protein
LSLSKPWKTRYSACSFALKNEASLCFGFSIVQHVAQKKVRFLNNTHETALQNYINLRSFAQLKHVYLDIVACKKQGVMRFFQGLQGKVYI